jgi:hypothetical protein
MLSAKATARRKAQGGKAQGAQGGKAQGAKAPFTWCQVSWPIVAGRCQCTVRMLGSGFWVHRTGSRGSIKQCLIDSGPEAGSACGYGARRCRNAEGGGPLTQ